LDAYKKATVFLGGSGISRPLFRAKKQETICNTKNIWHKKYSMHDLTRDAAEYDEASYIPDFYRFDDKTSINLEYEDHRIVFLRILHNTVTFFMNHRHDRLTTLAGVAFAIDHIRVRGDSMEEVARKIVCTKQAISKVATAYLDATGLPPPPSMKTIKARQTYKETNTNKYGTKRNNSDNSASH
jgi:hypothetical protein